MFKSLFKSISSEIQYVTIKDTREAFNDFIAIKKYV